MFHYAAIVKSLQLQKILLNREIYDTKINIRKSISSHINLTESTSTELNSFHQLQSMFLRLSILAHFDSEQQLYINLDIFKKFEFEAYVYYMKTAINDTAIKDTEVLKQKSIKSILFLSQLLMNVKTKYQSMKLEIVCII